MRNVLGAVARACRYWENAAGVGSRIPAETTSNDDVAAGTRINPCIRDAVAAKAHPNSIGVVPVYIVRPSPDVAKDAQSTRTR